MLRFCLRLRDYIDQVFIAAPAKNSWVTSRIFRYGLPEDFLSKVQKSYLRYANLLRTYRVVLSALF